MGRTYGTPEHPEVGCELLAYAVSFIARLAFIGNSLISYVTDKS